MMFASSVDFRLSLDFFDSGLYTRTAVARLTLALAKLSCFCFVMLKWHILVYSEVLKLKYVMILGEMILLMSPIQNIGGDVSPAVVDASESRMVIL